MAKARGPGFGVLDVGLSARTVNLAAAAVAEILTRCLKTSMPLYWRHEARSEPVFRMGSPRLALHVSEVLHSPYLTLVWFGLSKAGSFEQKFRRTARDPAANCHSQ